MGRLIDGGGWGGFLGGQEKGLDVRSQPQRLYTCVASTRRRSSRRETEDEEERKVKEWARCIRDLSTRHMLACTHTLVFFVWKDSTEVPPLCGALASCDTSQALLTVVNSAATLPGLLWTLPFEAGSKKHVERRSGRLRHVDVLALPSDRISLCIAK